MAKRLTSRGYEDPKGGMSAIELRALIIQILAGATGTDMATWQPKVSRIAVTPVWSSPRSNWTVAGKGTRGDKAAIETAAELVRQQHPYATAAA